MSRMLLLKKWRLLLVLLVICCRSSDGTLPSLVGPAFLSSLMGDGSPRRSRSRSSSTLSCFLVPPSSSSNPCRRKRATVPLSLCQPSTQHSSRSSPTLSTTRQSSLAWWCPRTSSTTATAIFVQSRSPTSHSIEEIIDEDDDTVEIYPYEHYLQELQHLVAITSRDATAVEQAMTVVDRMFRAYIETEDEAIFPNTEIYNALLNVHAFSCRREVGSTSSHGMMITTMEGIVERMQDPAVTTAPSPNAETYATLLDAYLQRHQYDRVWQWVEQQQPTSYANDTIIRNKLIQTHGRQGNCDAARQVLEDMLLSSSSSSSSSSNNSSAIPNHKTWVQVMRAYAAQGDAEAVLEIIDRMAAWQKQQQQPQDLNWVTATATRNALLQAYAMQGNAAAAERVLYQMIESNDNSNNNAQPDARSLEYVLQAYHRQKPRPGVVFKVEQCLALRDALAQRQTTRDTNSSQMDAWKLSPFTLYTAVAAMQRDTQDPLKLVKAARLLRERQNETVDVQAPPHVYRSLLNACSRYKAPNNNQSQNNNAADLATFQVAMDAFNQLVGQRDARVYGLLLRTAGRLLPNNNNSNKQRDAVIGQIFDQCCAAGYVNAYVLEMLGKAASDQLLLRTLGGFLEDGVTVPEKWSRNVKDAKISDQEEL